MNTVGLAAFVKRHWGGTRTWDRAQLVPWLEWFVSDERAVVIRRKGKVVGVGFGRVLTDEEDHANPYAHDERGALVWIDLIISKDRSVGSTLWTAMLKRFGKRAALGFQRCERAKASPRFHSFNQMERIMNYGSK
jgi:hypothetical protein